MKRLAALLIASAFFAMPAQAATNRPGQTVTAYVVSTFTTNGVHIDYFRVSAVHGGGHGGGTVFFTLAFDHGKAMRYKANVACAAVNGTRWACFVTSVPTAIA